MIHEACVHCGEAIVAHDRRRFEKRYTAHVVEDHGKPAAVPEGGAA